MAVSGIDHTIKIFSPDARDQYNARKGIGVQSADPGFSSLAWGRRRRARQAAERDDEDEDVDVESSAAEAHASEEQSDSDDEVAYNGLRSRKRMHEAYQITSQNDMDRKGGREDYFISVSTRSNITHASRLTVSSKQSLRSSLDISPHSKAGETQAKVQLWSPMRIAPSCSHWRSRYCGRIQVYDYIILLLKDNMLL